MRPALKKRIGELPRCRKSIVTLASGLILTCMASALAWKSAVERDRERFANMAEQFRQEFETRVERYELGLIHLAEWFSDNETASDSEWENRVARMGLRINFAGVTELAYSPLINERNRERWRHRAPAHWPPVDEWMFDSFPVWYQARGPWLRPDGWGRNLRTELEMLKNLQQAALNTGVVSSDREMVSGPDGGQPGFVFKAGVFPRDMPPDGPLDTNKYSHSVWPYDRGQQRAKALLGVVTAAVAIEPLLESIFGGRTLEIGCDIYAGQVAESNRLTRLNAAALTPASGALFSRIEIPWYFRRWNIVAVPNQKFFQHSHRSRAWLIAGVGTLFSIAMAWAANTEERSHAAAQAWGQSLEMARDELRAAHRERLRLSRDLHDGVLQGIYASVLALRRASRAVTRKAETAVPLIDGAVADLELTMREIRRFLTSTRQEGIAPGDLAAVLRGFVDAFNRVEQSKVALEFDRRIEAVLSAAQAEQLLHVIKEGVSNAHKHGHATDVRICFCLDADALRLTITDNGIGFSPETTSGNGHGLRYMMERAAMCGARFSIHSRPGGPTRLELTIPLSLRTADE